MNINEIRKQAVSYYKKNKIDQAISLYKKIIEWESGDWSLYWDLAYLCKKNKEYGSAIEHYLKASKLKPKNRAILNELGCSLFEKEKYVEAKKCFQELLSINSFDFEGLNNLGTIHIALGEYNDAIVAYDRALAIKKDKKTKENRKYAVRKLEESKIQKQLAIIIEKMKNQLEFA